MNRALLTGGILLLAGCEAFSFASAATLRTTVNVDHPRVRLSDLFDDLGKGQDTEIGDAPALGASYVVGGPQLTAIAAQFGVDWPDASPLVSVTVTHTARMITADDVLPVVREGLELPSEARVEVALTGFKPVPVPVADQGAPAILHIDRPPHGSEHFTARLEVPSAKGGQGTAFNVSGTATMEVRAVTLRHAMHLGQPILPDDVTMTFVRVGLIPDDALQNPEDAVGLEARGVLAAGQVLSVSQLAHPQLVHRGSPVVATFSGESLHLTVSGTVLETGGKGDTVHVYNASSHMVLTGRVVDRTEVEVIPGIMPLSADSRTHQQTTALPSL
ncbi:MAG: flagellar basal body P-ring formation chaperone FlgA [Gluconobacter sp.]|uniref:flagellar basal body P-ring formation chaperone FlgA n=1 Tax=Gluconobacter sp. TaxID=1876758 RepID=UPI0039E97AEB